MMVKVTNSDLIAGILRAKINRLKSDKSSKKIDKTSAPPKARPQAMDRLKELATDGAVDEITVKQAVIRSILIEEYGHELVEDPRFAGVMRNVLEQVESDPASARLFSEALTQLREG